MSLLLAQQPPSLQQPHSLLQEQQQPPPYVVEQQPPIQNFSEHQQSQQLQGLHMQLRERKKRGTKCGTGGTKLPHCKRLRYEKI